ncbi:glycerophosphodiester phosphodiesterase family protein [Maricaulis sp.]|uniref:glycerophosphodiester phosphodiesterase family protein n=1 Tax=Maricaulis sp. TaxID=1486257 RepID=UPI003A917D62
MRYSIWALAVAAGLSACAEPAANDPYVWQTLNGEPTQVIAHRGANGELPEHTIEAYTLAIEQGAEIIEPDLVLTSDGIFVVRHDRWLSDSTDIADHPEFADRRRVEGDRDDWWVDDFTFEEIRTLRARQVREGRPTEFDGLYMIPTFEEVLDLAAAHGVATEPEVKSPAAFIAAGLDPLPELVRILRLRGLDTADAPIAIQCFEPDFLARLNEEIDAPLLMLVFQMQELEPGLDPLIPTVALDDMVAFADGVGPYKALLVDTNGEDTGFIARAHALGLSVHPWTFRDDQPVADGADIETELRRIYALGADAVFTDFPATAVRVRDAMIAEGASGH